ncbi:MAG: TPM domain-containing protein [Chitinophagaceae bacterium]
MLWFCRFCCVLLALFFSIGCAGQKEAPLPEPVGWVSDFAQVFTSAQINYLDSLIRAHEAKTSNQTAVVTINPDSATITSLEDFEKYSWRLFSEWGVGQQQRNNGIGLIFSPALRYVRIETGPGLEGRLTDAEAQQIVDELILPCFKKQAYFEGVSKALEAIFRQTMN